MSTKAAAKVSGKLLTVDWGQEVRFDLAVAVRSQTETLLRAVPITLDFNEALREIPPPAEAA